MAAKHETTTAAPAVNDAYTGMLAISLIALVVGCLLLYLDYSQYPDSKQPVVPKAPAIAVPASPDTPAKVEPPPPQPKADRPPKAQGTPMPEVPADKK